MGAHTRQRPATHTGRAELISAALSAREAFLAAHVADGAQRSQAAPHAQFGRRVRHKRQARERCDERVERVGEGEVLWRAEEVRSVQREWAHQDWQDL